MKRYIKSKVDLHLYPNKLEQNELWDIAKDPTTPPEWLDEILETTDSRSAFEYVLQNPNISLDTLTDYINCL